MATVALEPMSQSAYVAFCEYAIQDYAAEHVKSGRWSEEESLAKSTAEFEHILPHGLQTPGQHFWTVRSESGDDVGVLWVATDRKPRNAYIYDIEMKAERRGEGFGTATMLALEAWCRANAIDSISLHVFGHNTGAWNLYKRLGYVETNVNMEKRLA